ncbi:HepT-like ribonuclease domain-containing protein [Oscillatoria salina]|uniref:HepT-like ribonuclease domain-containing protein n=1 Tax=Oscillatoria salina TaxID=331517 RepID=UPI0013BA0215|nr:HepT-like ribonuclease domain-containing protein [Oscillatoria salina]MBZ8183135.1 DUF86 domain-containing protein [Oscillatoria salina IIICB1]NET88298.1 DUF86 domain-containing protein [Kamptonema sp. SIO1D9]
MTDDQIYLEYIIQCIEHINEYTTTGREEFFTNSMIQDAVLRRLQTLAESTQRISADLKVRKTEIDWRSISGFRNILVHDYLGGIDLNVVWDVVEQDLPNLQAKLEEILQELGEI